MPTSRSGPSASSRPSDSSVREHRLVQSALAEALARHRRGVDARAESRLQRRPGTSVERTSELLVDLVDSRVERSPPHARIEDLGGRSGACGQQARRTDRRAAAHRGRIASRSRRCRNEQWSAVKRCRRGPRTRNAALLHREVHMLSLRDRKGTHAALAPLACRRAAAPRTTRHPWRSSASLRTRIDARRATQPRGPSRHEARNRARAHALGQSMQIIFPKVFARPHCAIAHSDPRFGTTRRNAIASDRHAHRARRLALTA
jgi:hypothetical protein